MKKQKRPELKTATVQTVQAPWRPKLWHYLVAALAAFLLTLEVYGPALNGGFVFDDEYLPFLAPGFGNATLREILTTMRPMVIASFWLNYQVAETSPYSYHFWNVVLHILNSFLVFHITRGLLRRMEPDLQRRLLLSLLASGIFLLHPLQTEAVSYVASRSEALSIFFAYGALAVFLDQKERGMTWVRTLVVLAMFGAACLTKEHTAVLPLVLLLADYYWHPGFTFEGIRRNWRLYLPLAIGTAGGAIFVYRVLKNSNSAGFALEGLTWYQYFFTEWRAIWVYVRMFLVPAGQSADHTFSISRTPFEHGAILCLVALLAVVGWAIHARRRYPLASFGILVFLLFLAPTSSIVPIRDMLVERRFYLPAIGLLLVLVEFFRVVPVARRNLVASSACLFVILSVLTWNRNHIWSSAELLWKDSLVTSPNNPRAHSQLALIYYNRRRCSDALPHFEMATKLDPTEPRALINAGLNYECLGRPNDALRMFQQAAKVDKGGYPEALIGMIHVRQGKRDEARKWIEESIRIEPDNDLGYMYRANLHLEANELEAAARDYRQAILFNPRNEQAKKSLVAVEAELKAKK